jgi:hypothetical protein
MEGKKPLFEPNDESGLPGLDRHEEVTSGSKKTHRATLGPRPVWPCGLVLLFRLVLPCVLGRDLLTYLYLLL